MEGTLYTIRNAETGNYMGSEDSSFRFVPTGSYTTAAQNFLLVPTTSAGGTAYTNLAPQDRKGTVRQSSGELVNTTQKAPTQSADRLFDLVEVDVTNPLIMLYRFEYHDSEQYIYESATANGSGGFYILTGVGYALDIRSVFAIEPATQFPPSTEEFDTSSIFVSNPVKNQLSIKGLSSNIKQVSVYAFLGQEVLAKKNRCAIIF